MRDTGKTGEDSTILPFPRRRGRPKVARPRVDMGTPELSNKRQLGVTTEALDLCLARGIVSDEQHWCGIHLRWLYTLRHGAPGVRAVDPTHFGGREIRLDDPDWRVAREQEYHEAMIALAPSGAASLLMNLCVFNERPAFLQTPKRLHKDAIAIIEKLREGLDLLSVHWKRARL